MLKKSSVKKSKKNNMVTGLNFTLQKIKPMTENQQKTFDLYKEGKNLLLCGYPGTGKNYISTYLAFEDIIENSSYEKIIFIRSSAPTREIGFLPGDEKEKMGVYSSAFSSIVNNLFNRDDAYDIMTKKNILIFESTSFLRGVTFENSLIIVDETQNLTLHEASTVISRLGENSRIILCGDAKQCDLNPKKETSGFNDIVKILSSMEEFSIVEFGIDDIVRSGLVKSFIIAKEKLGL